MDGAAGSNLDKLKDAGIVGDDHDLSDSEVSSVEGLSSDDVDALIRVHGSMSSPAEGGRARSLGIG
jgi:hypothetical protein